MQTNCYHCGLSNDPTAKYSALVLGKQQSFCCPGCLAVAEAIVDNGLDDYYHYRNEFADKANSNDSDILQQLSVFDDGSIIEEFVDTQKNHSEIQLTITGINCAACGWLIEKQLSKITGIKKIGVNVSAHRASVSWDNEQLNLSQILLYLERIGYHGKPFQAEAHEAAYREENRHYLKRLGLAGLMTMQVMMLNIGVFFDLFGHIDEQTKQYFNWVSLLLTTPVMLYSASGFYKSALRALSAKAVNMDVPIVIALTVTFASSFYATVQHTGQTYFESLCMFIFLLLISRYIEHAARYKASQLTTNMLEYMPTGATLITDTGHKTVLAKSLIVNQTVLVKAGEVVPVDGLIEQGEGQLDEAMLTGEFNLVHKIKGDTVYAGTLNQLGTLTVKVSKSLKYSAVNEINKLQAQAMNSKPKIASLADQFSQYFVAAVLAISIGTYWYWHTIDPQQALWITVSVLIATCPCALGLATPSALSCAIAHLNSKGILLKRSDALEQLTQVNWIGLDKTGTLTEGQFTVAETVNISNYSETELLSLVASIEKYSEHPIAKAFTDYNNAGSVTHYSATIGKGLSGTINHQQYKIGSAKFMDFPTPKHIQHCNLFFQSASAILCGFVLTDKVRDKSAEFVQSLSPKTVTLISGDSSSIVKSFAHKLKIEHWLAEQTPQKKLDVIKQAQDQSHIVLMVGDGINDAPVLSQADVSITLGAASDLAKSSADIVLLDNSLDKLSLVFRIASRCKNKIVQNISWAIAYNLLVLPLAVSGLLSPWMAVLGMSLSSLIVVINSVRLLK